MAGNPELDGYFANAKRWRAGMQALRAVVLSSGLTEEKKWFQPVYTLNGANVAIIGSFKDFFTLAFFKGVLLTDTEGHLHRQGQNTQGSRILRLTDVDQIGPLTPVINRLLAEAIALEIAGAKVDYSANLVLDLPEELQAAFAAVDGLEAAFRALTPGRQRAYNLHFTGAKASPTRAGRIARCTPDILAGKGFNGR